ncbi:hypothetical protein CQW23_29625 [Capsicum baccatum]|uniref:R13L1/DRL21-like LRR repeat region domain-containing protein n=1 Tax=Capsicum baccatum TaxID=33114 RepID=A0A2G2VCS1_CAPBA|nr:hypothetical protein CQW23_29625 [Capsicum baccatum]
MPLNMGLLTSLQTLQVFKVALEKGRRLEELGRLKKLKGKLTINGLQLVGNREEAQTAYLRKKPNIYKLTYVWSHDEPERCETNDEYVLYSIQPHPNLKTLEVVDYLGTRFPSWFSEELLPNLVKLELRSCKMCREIPSLGQLKLLRHLELVGSYELECIAPAFYGVEVSKKGIIQVFQSLKELVLVDMHSLIEWKGVELIPATNGARDEVRVRMFTGLEKLRITKRPLLKSTPNQFEILRELEIKGVDSEMPLLNLCSNLTSLVKLKVSDVKELTCLPDDMLRNNVFLQHLSVSHCGEFRELPGVNYLTSLQGFWLYNCDGLTSLPSGILEHYRSIDFLRISDWGLHRLTGLRRLCIGPFSEMVDFDSFQLIFNDIQQVLSLRKLEVYGRLQRDSLPYQLMELSALTRIYITDFGIHGLPRGLANITSLEKLVLWRCKRLQHVDFLDAMPTTPSIAVKYR